MKCKICKWFRDNRKDGDTAHCTNPDPRWNVSDATWENDRLLVGCLIGELVQK